MALIYDELGNVIGEDDPSVDEMRYALSLPKTIQRMVTSPANDVSALSKAQTYKDIAGGFGSAGESLVRGAGAAALGLTGDIFKHFQETPFIPGVTDKITLSDMFPGADRLMPKQEQTYELPVRRQPNMSYPEPRAKQEIMGLPYATTSDILEAAPSRMTAPFGDKTANDFMETLGMFLQPSMQAGARQGIINMVEATGKVPSLTRDSAQAFARDYTNAMNGVYPEAPTAGSMAADFARTGKAAAEDFGDVMARRAARMSDEGRMSRPGSVQVFSDMVPDTRMYAVRPTSSQGQVLREVPTELNPSYNVAQEANLTLDLENILNRARPTKDLEIRTREQPFTNFVPDNFGKSANDLFKEFITPRLQAEFPGLQNEDLLRAARVKYGDGLNTWMKSQLEDFSKTPEVQAYNIAATASVENDPERFSDRLDSLKDVLVVPPSVKIEGMKAADSWIMRNLQNYFVEHVGTESDPGLKEIIETGKSNLIPESQLEEYADDNARTATSFRNRAGMPVEGVVRPMLVEARTQLAQIEVQLQDLQNQFNDLVNANPGVRPTEIPGIKELYKEKQKLTKVKDKVVERSANLEKAILYEDYMDANVRPIKESSFVEDLNPINAQRFPMIPTNKDYMYQMNVPDPVAQLGKDVVSELELGLLTPEAAKSMSVPTAAKMRAELIAKREQTAEKLAQQNIEQLKSYIIQETQSLPQDGKYGKGVVVKFDNTLSKDQMQKAMSSETEWMDHCIGRAGSPDKNTLSRKAKALGKDNVSSDDKYVGYVPMLASHKPGRVVPRGSSGTSTSYMNDFLSGDGEGRSFRDDATGVPFATMKVKKLSTGPNAGKYSIGEFYGYKDRTVDGPWYEGKEGPYSIEERNEYRQVVADWANDHANQLAPTNNDDRRLIRFANIYDMQSPDHRGSLTALLGIRDDALTPIVDQVGKRFVTADEAKIAKRAMEVQPTTELEALKETKKDIERTLRHGGLDDEEEMVLRGQVQDLNDEIRQLEERERQIAADPNSAMRVAVQDAFREYNTWLTDRHPTIQSRLDQIGDDMTEISAGRMSPNQFGLNDQEFNEFVQALGREQRSLINQRNAGIQNQVPANQPQEIAPLEDVMAMEMNRIRDTYGEHVERQVDSILTSIYDNYDLNDDTPLFIERVRTNAEIRANDYPETAEALQHVAALLISTERNNVAIRRANFEAAPAQVPAMLNQDRQGGENVLPAVRTMLNNLPGIADNAFVRDAVAQTVVDVSNQVNFETNPAAFIQSLRNQSQILENRPVTRETNARDQADSARLVGALANELERMQPQQIQAEPTAVQRVTLQAAQNDAFGVLGEPLNQDARNLVDLIVLQNPTQLNVIAVNTLTEALRIRNGDSFAHLNAEDRIALSNALNDFAREIAPTQVPVRINPPTERPLDPAFVEYVHSQVDLAQSGDDIAVLQSRFLPIDNPMGYSTQQRETIGQILRDRAWTLANGPDMQRQVPALRAQRVEDMALIDMTPNDFEELQGNIVQNLINQYPEPRQIQSLINDLEHGSYDELPMVVRQEMDENQANSFVTQIIGDLERYRDSVPAVRQQLRGPAPADLNIVLEDALRAIEGLHGPAIRERALEIANSISNDIDLTDNPEQYISQLRRDAELYQGNGNMHAALINMADDLEGAHLGNFEPEAPQQLPAPENPAERHTDVTSAYTEIMNDNQQFTNPEGLNTLRALPQLIRRRNLRYEFGTAGLTDEEVEQLARIFQSIYESRAQQFANDRLPPPEGRKDGGHVLESYEAAKRKKELEKYERLMQPPPPNYDDGASMLFNRTGRTLDLAHPNAGHRKGYADDYTREHMEALRQEDAVRRGTPMIAKGGSIQSSKNRLLSPNTDEMRYALLKGK
jgi:hypothetical protein